MIRIKTNKIAGGGIISALSLIMLFGAAYVPNLMLAFLFAASIIVGVCILRYKTLCALTSYAVTSIIAVFFIPDIALLFFVLFGIYPIVKLHIEKIRKIILEYIFKFIVWNIVLILLYVVLQAVGKVYIWDFGLLLLWFVGIVLLLFYDFVFTVVINAFYKSYYKYLK